MGKGLTVDHISPWSRRGRVMFTTSDEAGKPAKEVLAGLPEVLASLTFPCQHALANNTFWIHSPSSHLWSFFWATKRWTLISWISNQVVSSWTLLSNEVEITNADFMKIFVPFTWLRIAKNVETWFASKQGHRSRTGVQVQIEEGLWTKSWTWSNSIAFMGSFDTKYLMFQKKSCDL